MSTYATRLLLAALTVVVLVATTTAEAHIIELDTSARAAAVQQKRCTSGMFKVKDFRWYAKRVYKRKSISSKAHRRMRMMHICQSSWPERKAVGLLHDRLKSKRSARMQFAVPASLAGWLHSTSMCESGSSGWYSLRTTGNGFWFAFQFTPSTWASVGGRMAGGTPVGINGEAVPSRREQNYRAWRVLLSQGRGAWPNCG